MITLKSSASERSHAIYAGLCRIGYIQARNQGGFLWNISLVDPKGGAAVGVADDLETARRDVARAFAAWCEAAGLEEKRQCT